MLASTTRVAPRSVSQCLYRTQQALPKSRPHQSLQKRWQTTKSKVLLRPGVAIHRKPTLACHVQRRHSSDRTLAEGFRLLFKAHPFEMTMWTCLMAFCAYLIYVVVVFYREYIIGQFIDLPEPVAKHMRKALYYTNVDLQPKSALKYYKLALQTGAELGMDPMSEAVFGMKVQFSMLFEKVGQHHKAIEILALVKRDNLFWLEDMGNKPGNEAKRSRVLAKTIQISCRLGGLYACEYVKEKENAEEELVWAVTTMLKEVERREREGVKPDEVSWLSKDEMGAALESLGDVFVDKDQHYLAAPLYLHALQFCAPKSCHATVTTSSISQQSPPAVPGQAAPSRATLISNARSWAEKAIALAATITPPERNEECDRGCVAATHHLGMFAEMDGNIAEARKYFQEAKSLSQAIKFEQGVTESEMSLQRLPKT